ncbi:uncharacterized protein LOC110466720 [Mizuhopecten yessoensis]|uniref:Uncharacterized protein n=1 Tax=Mizuhopecten yessoensis TaxID=6573 RepID=A0A210PNJ2_MIZYE|nr:uncharacterized protein LOC110466720 [Mizuhopecten yessoensis]OWF38047.1 hypothetical protein KP79_PYT12801 [Mizuhopecten yessoensis]
MDALDREFDHWLGKSPSNEDIIEVLEVLEKKKEETFKQLEGIRDHEKDEVAALQARLKLLRGVEKEKKTTDSSAGSTPIQQSARNLSLARSSVVSNNPYVEKDENGVLRRNTSNLFPEIVKAVFDFVRKEQREQTEKIAALLHVDEQEKGNILNLQRTLGYDIEKALLQRFFDEVWPEKICKPYSAKLPLLDQSMVDKDGKHDQLRNFVDACIKLVWLMLMETPPLVFCWEISKSHYRYPAGVRGEFHINDRVIDPAITMIKHENGKMEMKNVIKGLLQDEPREQTPITKAIINK